MLTFVSLIALASAAAIPSVSPVLSSDAALDAREAIQNTATNLTTNVNFITNQTTNTQCFLDVNMVLPFEFPHLIMPTDKEDPKKAPGTSFWAEISTRKTTIYNFDIPHTDLYIGKTCSLIFSFPYKDMIKQAPRYEWSGLEAQEYSHGGIVFSKLTGPVNTATTFENTPAVEYSIGKFPIYPGSHLNLGYFNCNAGSQQTFSLAGAGAFDLKIFESQEVGAPQGLFIVPCH